MTTDFKLKLYPALIGILTTIIVVLVWGRVVPLMRTVPARSPTPASPRADRTLALPGLSAIATVPWTESLARPVAPSAPVASPEPPAAIASPVGRFRVSNSTAHVVRVVLLGQSAPSTDTPNPASRYREAVHWDFAPGEGVGKGLILSLPDAELQLQANDVLVAFSLDGSQRYWGPYVVGQTALPVWNEGTGEWTLDLTPKPSQIGSAP